MALALATPGAASAAPKRLPELGRTTLAAETVPPVTVPPVSLPPVTVPPVTLPPVTLPPLTVPSVNLPGLTVPRLPIVGSKPPPTNPELPVTSPATAPSGSERGDSGPARGRAVDVPGGGARRSLDGPAVDPGPGSEKLVNGREGGPLPVRLRTAAVETARQLSFPMGLALAIAGFLLVQYRMDRADPRVASHGVTHEDDLLGFR